MTSFRTTFPSFESKTQISHQNPILSIGSCFAENIAGRLSNLKFQTLLNPFGIVYNPMSIKHIFEFLRSNKLFEAQDLVFDNGLWHSLLHHGDFSAPDKEWMLENLNAELERARKFIRTCDRMIITFGTATAYRYRKTEQIVANCHKIANREFEKIRLSPETIFEALNGEFQLLKSQSPNLEILLTVSPVRHIRDGFVENQRSKAALLLATERLCAKNDCCHYFPAYEIVLDDLRDYRFFSEDLVHPNKVAVDYVWAYFEKAFFENPTRTIVQKLIKLNQAIAHRPLHPDTKAHQVFLRNQLSNIELLEKDYSFLDFEVEKANFLRQIH